MKKTIYLACCMLIGFILISCTKVLDKKPLDSISDANMWTSKGNVQGYVDAQLRAITLQFDGIGNNIPWGVFIGEGTDEAISRLSNIGGMTYFTTGTASPANPPNAGSWDQWYLYLQSVNTFFSNDSIGRILGTESDLNFWRGQMYYVRAWIHTQLMLRYGAILLAKKAFTADMPINQTQSSYEECVQFVLSDLEKAIELLPLTIPTAQAGRPNKGTAMTLKARVLLNAASALHNENQDKAKWQAASDAFKAVIELKNEGGTPMYALYHPTDYKKILWDYPSAGNTEVIYARYLSFSDLVFWYNFPTTMFGPKSWGGWYIGQPIQSIVDAFQMADGTNYDRSIYGQDPYSNREPRFYANILTDSAEFSSTLPRNPSQAMVGIRVRYCRYIKSAGDTILGIDNPGGTYASGYNCNKFLNKNATIAFDKSNIQAVYMRLAEVYLSYAECQMELGKADEARKYILLIRQRANLPDASLPDPITMEDIRHERRIELAFEGHRFWDVRRWKILQETFLDAERVDIIKDLRNHPMTTTYLYKMLEPRSKAYKDAFYYFPISQDECFKNPALQQSPGY